MQATLRRGNDRGSDKHRDRDRESEEPQNKEKGDKRLGSRSEAVKERETKAIQAEERHTDRGRF